MEKGSLQLNNGGTTSNLKQNLGWLYKSNVPVEGDESPMYSTIPHASIKLESEVSIALLCLIVLCDIDTTRYRDTKVVVLTLKFGIIGIDYAI